MIGRVTVGAALALLIVLHVGSVAALIARAPFLDEVESLQGGVRVARGERPYRDFAEHHPPLLFAALASFAPPGGIEAIQQYVIRARIVFAIFGVMAMVSAASIVWYASKQGWAPIIFIAALLSSPSMWLRAFADVHPEPPSLALWWLGAALILLPRTGAFLRGVGLGLIGHACLWNPKWPIASIAIGIVFLLALANEKRRAVMAVSVALLMIGAGVVMIAKLSDLQAFAISVFGLTRAMFRWSVQLQRMHLAVTGPEPSPWQWCPRLFLPRYVAPATMVVLIALWRAKEAFGNRRIASVFVALIAATLIEIRFVYWYPAPWVQYYVLWSMAGAAMYAFLPQAIGALFLPRRPRIVNSVAVAACLLAIFGASNVIPLRPALKDPYWQSFEYLHRHLQPGDRVFIDLARHPIGAFDASYYWFGFDSFVVVALQYARTPAGSRVLPPITEQDLPPCRLERGLEPHLRFLSGDTAYRRLPKVASCFARLRAAGAIVPSPVPGVYRVSGRGSPTSSAAALNVPRAAETPPD
jgi:hypothetical protein